MQEVAKVKSVSGKLISFLVMQASGDIKGEEVVGTKGLKRVPRYIDILPRQKVVKVEKKRVGDREITFLVKAYLPRVIIVEASVDIDNFFDGRTQSIKGEILDECHKVISEFKCDERFEEEYSIHCISNYEGNPEEIISNSRSQIASMLKNEISMLDNETVDQTLSIYLKYAKDDKAIFDWDGAFLFDSRGDFDSEIELLEIANIQLLKLRILDDDLNHRLEKMTQLLHRRHGPVLFRSREVRRIIGEIIMLRSDSILASESIEREIRLIGDWYSARLYDIISKKFFLEAWKSRIDKKLSTLADVYTMASDNLSISLSSRLEFAMIVGWLVLLVGYFFLFYFEVVAVVK